MYVMIPLAIIFIGIALYILASTTDEYLCPALETIAEKFHCSESLAGVTLLAFGAGAADLFAAIAAGGEGSGDDINL